MAKLNDSNSGASSRGVYFNTGNGLHLQPIDIKHKDYIGIVSADTAFWVLVKKSQLGKVLTNPLFFREFYKKEKTFINEMERLRFGLKPSAVYFNPTDRCNLNCAYCYIPERLRKYGSQMSVPRLYKALEILKVYFKTSVSKGSKPQIIFHGAEPMLNYKAILPAMDRFQDYFRFGIQTNATLLDARTIEFLTAKKISIGLSLDGHIPSVADDLRRTWSGEGVSLKVIEAIRRLKGYHNYSVICTVTNKNTRFLSKIVDFLHNMGVAVCMLNPVRCTRKGAQEVKPPDHEISKYYTAALSRTYELYQKTGRRLVVANFANILLSIIAPTARRLMCDISPCGGGRCFFAVSAAGDLFPCSEFIGLRKFKGGNLFKDKISEVLESKAFRLIRGRRAESIQPCVHCAIRHFCGSPCPAEAHEMNGSLDKPGAFCELYEEQVRYALRIIADGKQDAYLWDGWDKNTITTFTTISKLTNQVEREM